MFELVMKDVSLQGTHRFHERLSIYERRLETGEFDGPAKVDLRLALLRLRRMRSVVGPSEFNEQLKAIQPQINTEDLQLKFLILKAEYCVHVKGDFASALPDLESAAAQLQTGDRQHLYAIVAYALGVAHMRLGNEQLADDFAQDCASISRREGYLLLHAHSLNLQAVTRRIRGQYVAAERLFRRAYHAFAELENPEGQIYAGNNLGIAKMRMGEWRQAEHYFQRAMASRVELDRWFGTKVWLTPNAAINLLRLRILRRQFEEAAQHGKMLLEPGKDRLSNRQRALLLEFMSDLDFETGNRQRSRKLLAEARVEAGRFAPAGDVMTEVQRRMAHFHFTLGDDARAHDTAKMCIRTCRHISDQHELGAALRVLAQVHARQARPAKALSAFQTSVATLKASGDAYELMLTCLAYAEFLLDTGKPDAEMYILEAKQLCGRLELDFFMSRILFLSARLHFVNKEYTLSRTCLKEAESIAENLQSCDRKQLMPAIKGFYKTLEQAILRVSMKSAEKLKTLGKIYEESRFPLEELRPEMAADVARNVGVQCLFLVRKRGRGFQVPIKYDISAEDAKRIVRMQLRNGAADLFETGDPRVIPQTDGRTLVAVAGQSGNAYVLCAMFPERKLPGAGEVEFLIASVNAMERVAEEYSVPTTPSPLDPEGFFETKGLKHPGGHFKDILTLDKRLIEIIHLAERAAKTPVPILLQGETGCGKELFAQAIHSGSPRRDRAFIAMNAGGVPVNLFESQLFGHVKGAFTDAVTDRTGLIEEARGGTLFLDEVGEMGEELQVKLLRLLENGEYRRLGENDVRQADVRVISATNKNLEKRVDEGLFREDLYYRLATVSFEIPPLRARKRDVELLVRHFLKDGLARIGRPNDVVHFDVKALEAFELYQWPGNVRELRNEIMRDLSLLGAGEVVRFGMLSEKIKRTFESQNEGGLLGSRVERFERRLILKALEDNEWNRLKTAEDIGIPRTTLLFKMRKLNIVQ